MKNYKLYKEKMRSEAQRPLALVAVQKILRDMNVTLETPTRVQRGKGAA